LRHRRDRNNKEEEEVVVRRIASSSSPLPRRTSTGSVDAAATNRVQVALPQLVHESLVRHSAVAAASTEGTPGSASRRALDSYRIPRGGVRPSDSASQLKSMGYRMQAKQLEERKSTAPSTKQVPLAPLHPGTQIRRVLVPIPQGAPLPRTGLAEVASAGGSSLPRTASTHRSALY
jgi:hypothetical protein